MFTETSHHRSIPFWAKNIPYIEGGELEGKSLIFLTYPGQFLQSWAPWFSLMCQEGVLQLHTMINVQC